MEKVMKVSLSRTRPPSEEHGKLYQHLEWEIPYESLEKNPQKSPLEQDMLNELHTRLPEQFHTSVNHMLYGDMSSGGNLGHGEYTLKVSFSAPDIMYNYRAK